MKRLLQSPEAFLFISLAALAAVDVYRIPEHYAYLDVNPNPYLILSVVLSAFYGLRVALIASVTASAVFLLSVHLNLNYEEVETLFDFQYLSIPLLLTITSVVIGELKQRNIDRLNLLQREIVEGQKTHAQLLNKESVQEKEIVELKKRLVSRLETARSFYEIATSFHSLEEETLLANFRTALARLFKTDQVTITPVRELSGDLCPLSKEALRLEKQTTIEDVFSLKAFTQHKTSSLLSIPLLLNGNPEYLVEISNIPFLDYIPSNFKVSELYAQWVSSSLVYGRTYQTSMRNKIWNDQLQIYQNNFFKERIAEEFNRSKTYMLPLTVLKVNVTNFQALSTVKAQAVRRLVSGLFLKAIRKLDYITEGRRASEFFLVFPILDTSHVEIIWEEVDREFRKLNLLTEEGAVALDHMIFEFNPNMNNLDEFLGDLAEA